MLKEFREFAMKGNVLDMAVGIIIGTAFGKIVSSLVSDIIMPPIGGILGGVNFKDMFINLKIGEHYDTLADAQAHSAPVIAYGNFINVILDFTIVAFCIFLIVKGANALRRLNAGEPETVTEPTEKVCPYCLSKIPIKATRCGHCTSHLNDEEHEGVQEGLS